MIFTQKKMTERATPTLDKTHIGTYSDIGINFSFCITTVESRGITPSACS